jgi:1-acyl-sn-glycerol-3-phosphate acyltransferase
MNKIAEFIGRRLFRRAVVNERLVEKIRDLSDRGTIVYVLRHHSFVDYFMINFVLRREELPLPVFTNGLVPWALAPLGQLAGMLRRARSGRKTDSHEASDLHTCAAAVAAGAPVLVFLRGPREPGASAAEHEQAARAGNEYLRRIMQLQGARPGSRRSSTTRTKW